MLEQQRVHDVRVAHVREVGRALDDRAAAARESGRLARERLESSFARIIAAFGEAKRGDTLLLDYHPERGLRVWRNGSVVGQFAGLELNRMVLSLWLGPQVPSDLRNPLLGVATAFDATH